MHERPCALHEGGTRQGTRQNRCGSLGPGHLGLVCLDLVLYQRHSAFALALLVTFEKEDDSRATG